MVGLEAAMLASAAVAFTMFLWLLVYGRDHSRADFAAYADAHGWNHRHDAPPHLVAHASELTAVPAHALHGPYFAGPSGAGPFQALGLRHSRNGRHSPKGSWAGDRTLVHVRTATASPGLRFGPQAVFALSSDPAVTGAVGHSGFLQRYNVHARDRAFVAAALDYETCELLLRPRQGVLVSWRGHDLYLMFPVRPGTMAGYETLLRYSVALTRRLERHDGRALPLTERPTVQVSPDAIAPLSVRHDALAA